MEERENVCVCVDEGEKGREEKRDWESRRKNRLMNETETENERGKKRRRNREWRTILLNAKMGSTPAP